MAPSRSLIYVSVATLTDKAPETESVATTRSATAAAARAAAQGATTAIVRRLLCRV